jgi:ribosome maturation factor RimP
MDTAGTERLRATAEGLVDAHGARIVEFLLRGAPGHRVLELRIDNEEGVTLDLCSAVSRAVAAAIEGIGEGSWRLEVSSPGIGRPLKFPWQYRKHVGRLLEVRRRLGDEEVTLSGELVAVDEAGIAVRTGEGAEAARILFADVMEAAVKAPW